MVLSAFLLAGVLAPCPAAGAEEELLESDGTRAAPVHRILLYHPEDGRVKLTDDPVLPFSSRTTCGKCHDYKKIATGLHFSEADAKAASGRPGEPWIIFEPRTGTQIPVSGRNWPGVHKPEALGLKPFRFLLVFGRNMPGGSYGEVGKGQDNPRWDVSGKLDINCLVCHSASPAQCQTEYAMQVGQQNFMWAAAAAGGLAVVKGAASKVSDDYDPFMESDTDGRGPKVFYDKTRFDADGKVLLDLVRRINPSRCYICHTVKQVGQGAPEPWHRDPNVHIAAGMTCTDCHRNGLEHQMSRGYPGQPAATTQPSLDTLTCEGCHLGGDKGGRFRAPEPIHEGLPTVHLDKLTCTVCHSGPRPKQHVGRVQTSKAHMLGLQGKHKGDDWPPHILSPVFIRQDDGMIGPHRVLYPSMWGRLKADGSAVVPLTPTVVLKVANEILTIEEAGTPAEGKPKFRPLTAEQVKQTLAVLAKDTAAGEPVYITGGRLYRLGSGGQLQVSDNAAADPYHWPLAHEVRPARQALGVGGAVGCEHCHAPDSPFFFGEVKAPALADLPGAKVTPMYEFQELDGTVVWAFAQSFMFRPYLKVTAFVTGGIVAAVAVLYGFYALGAILKRFSKSAGGGGER